MNPADPASRYVYLSCLHCLMLANIVFVLTEQFAQI